MDVSEITKEIYALNCKYTEVKMKNNDYEVDKNIKYDPINCKKSDWKSHLPLILFADHITFCSCMI